jgi:hypothetical protein
MSTAYHRDFLQALVNRGARFIILTEHSDAHNGLLLWAQYGDALFNAYKDVRLLWRAIAPGSTNGRPSDFPPPPDLLVEQPGNSTLRMRTANSRPDQPPPEGSIYVITSVIDPEVSFEEAYRRSRTRDLDGLRVRVPAEHDFDRIRSLQAV